MSSHTRRGFMTLAATSFAAGMFHTIFKTGRALGAQLKRVDPFEQALGNASKANLRLDLNGSSLNSEEKLAIAAVKQLDRRDLEHFLVNAQKDNPRGESGDKGSACGSKCGQDCGSMCGDNCPHGSNGVIDSAGALGINFNRINKDLFRSRLQRALQLTR